MMSVEIAKAMAILRMALEEDKECAYAWHANLAMCFEDELMQNKSSDARVLCNDAASRCMKLLFDVETSRNMLLDESESEA
jgi:hypothetical protein